MRRALLLFALTIALSVSASPLTPGSHTIEIEHAGRTRSYIVHVPPGSSKNPLPLVINFHGGGGNAEHQEQYSGMNRVADHERFLVMYPDGTGRTSMHTWNAGTCCAYAEQQHVDDVGFVRTAVEDLAKRVAVDRSRIYATGMSNGGMMTYRMAAEASDLIAAAAPVAGSMVLVGFNPSRAVPIMHIHSVDDPRAPYGGGLGPPFPMTDNRVLHPSVEQQLAKWIAFNGCPTEATVEKTLHGKAETPDANNGATKYVYAPCKSGAPVVLWKLSGSGHVWPGSDRSALRLLGQKTHVIDANEEIWAFFKQFKR